MTAFNGRYSHNILYTDLRFEIILKYLKQHYDSDIRLDMVLLRSTHASYNLSYIAICKH